jgi:DNA-binding transcriptional LysR family regulator
MELRQIRHLIAVAETLNFSRAAEAMHMAQPPLSVSIRKLEEELGVRLFERGPRFVTITRAGELALAAARQALAYVDETARIAKSFASGDAGTLRVAFVGGATFRLFPQRLPEFRRKYPNVELELSEATTAQVLEWVEAGSVDVGIVRHPLAHATKLSLYVLESDRLAAALPQGHRLTKRVSLRLADLRDESFIMYSHSQAPSMHAVALLACQRAGFDVKVAQEAVQIQTIISLVQSGFGVALVPASCADVFEHRIVLKKIVDHIEALAVGLALVVKPQTINSLGENFLTSMSGRQRR